MRASRHALLVISLVAALAACSPTPAPLAEDLTQLSAADLDKRAAKGDTAAMSEVERRALEQAKAEDVAKAPADPQAAFDRALEAGDEAQIKDLADAGNPYARFHIAARTIDDPKAAAAAKQKARADVLGAADAGVIEAQIYLGKALAEGGHGFKQDHAGAVKWTEAAAEAGNAEAMFEAAQLQVEGPAPNLDRARLWYKRAADAGVNAASAALMALDAANK